MSMNVGDDFEWYEPFDPSSDTVGSHLGPYASLNLKNAQPNTHYYYLRNDPNEIVEFMNNGWLPVADDDPELFGHKHLDTLRVQSKIDGLRAYQDVVLFKIPVVDPDAPNDYSRIQEANAQLNRSMMDGVVSAHKERGESRAREFGSNASTEPTYYARPQHGIEIEDLGSGGSTSK